MECVDVSNKPPRDGLVVVTGPLKQFESVDQVLDGNLSPHIYRQRERVDKSNVSPHNGNVTARSPLKTVDEIFDENKSPLTYYQRAREFLPPEEEPSLLAHYFASL
jgi:hypothetical protein